MKFNENSSVSVLLWGKLSSEIDLIELNCSTKSVRMNAVIVDQFGLTARLLTGSDDC